MSQEKVEIVRRDIAARDARDWAALPEIWHPDIEWKLVRGGTYHGLGEITDFLKPYPGCMRTIASRPMSCSMPERRW